MDDDKEATAHNIETESKSALLPWSFMVVHLWFN